MSSPYVLGTPALCYIDATRVTSSVGKLAGFQVHDVAGHKLGRLDGFVIDPGARRVRYLVVLRGWLSRRRYLLPLRTTRIERERHIVRVEIEDGRVTHTRFEPKRFPNFSDEHFLAALFLRAQSV